MYSRNHPNLRFTWGLCLALSASLTAQSRPQTSPQRSPQRIERPMPQPQRERPMRESMPQRETRPQREQRIPRSEPGMRPQGQLQRPGVPTVENRPRMIVHPRPLPRITMYPGEHTWKQRDIMQEIQQMSRRGSIRVTPVDELTDKVSGAADFPAGWRAYGFRVPPGENIHMRLRHSNEGWFRLVMVNKWGSLEEGMLQNVIPTGNPEVKYSNPTKEARSVYVIVDDPGWMSTSGNPYEITVTRSWDPKAKDIRDVKVVEGIWAEAKPESAPDSNS